MYRVLRTTSVRSGVAAFAGVVLAMLAACGGGGEGATTVGGAPATGDSRTSGTVAAGGPRSDAAVANQYYQFVPEIGDAGGAELAFTIENPPAWAAFDASTGILAGTPGAADVGSRSTVRITAVAGARRSTVELQLQVVASAEGVVNVALDAPSTRTDGTVLQNLAGYRIYYGKSPTRLHQFVDVKGGTATTAVVSQLTPGTWYFAATAYDANGLESEATEPAYKTIG